MKEILDPRNNRICFVDEELEERISKSWFLMTTHSVLLEMKNLSDENRVIVTRQHKEAKELHESLLAQRVYKE